MANYDIKVYDEDECDCPLRSDVNSCNAKPEIGINGCPVSVEDQATDGYIRVIPPGCPLRNGQITITLTQN